MAPLAEPVEGLSCDDRDPLVARGRDGHTVVAWENESYELVLQRLDGAARPLGSPDVVAPVNLVWEPALSMADDGRFVVVWDDFYTGQLQGHQRTPDLGVARTVFPAEAFTTGSAEQPAVAIDSEGHFVVAWSRYDPGGFDLDGSGRGIFARRYNWKWGPVGGEFQVNSVTAGNQRDPAVAAGRDGTFTVAWESQDEEGNSDVRLQRFGPWVCVADDDTLCFQQERFAAEVRWRDFAGRTGTGHAVPLTADTGYFWFFGPRNVEVVVKVLDGRGINGHFWVFYGALSSVEYTLTVRDAVTGFVREYHNPPRRFASVGDTEAFPGSG